MKIFFILILLPLFFSCKDTKSTKAEISKETEGVGHSLQTEETEISLAPSQNPGPVENINPIAETAPSFKKTATSKLNFSRCYNENWFDEITEPVPNKICETVRNKLEIYVVGEKHGSALSPLEWLRSEAKRGHSYTFYELRELVTPYKSDINGLMPNWSIRDFTLLRIFQVQGPGMLKHYDRDSNIKDMFGKMLGDIESAVRRHPKQWEFVKNSFSAEHDFVEVFEKKFRTLLTSGEVKGAPNRALKNWKPSTVQMDLLLEIVEKLLKKLEGKVLGEPTSKGFTGEFLKFESIGAGREVTWARTIAENYCGLAKLNKPIYILVGRGHATNIDCVLKQALGDLASIKTFKDGMKGALSRSAELFIEKKKQAMLSEVSSLYREKGYDVHFSDFALFANPSNVIYGGFMHIRLQRPETDRTGKQISQEHEEEILQIVSKEFKLQLYSRGLPGINIDDPTARGHSFWPLNQVEYSILDDFL